METIEKKIEDIIPYFKNAKEHPEKQIKKIADSIREFGFNQPLVLDTKGVIIVGHGRYLAAQFLGMETVPTIVLDLDEEKVKAYRLADNRLNESDWDMSIVIDELKTLSLQMIDLTGFDSNLILETKEDDPDLSAIGVPQSILGDIYALGDHKLICGDSCDPNTYKSLLGDEKARLIFTDPPYSIDYQSTAGMPDKFTGKKKKQYSYDNERFGGTGGRIFNDDKTPAEALEFYKKALAQLHAFSTNDASIYWWFATRLVDINLQALKEEGWHISQTIFWLKNSLIFSPDQLYHRIYEPCMVGWKQGLIHYQSRTFTNLTEMWTTGLKTFAEHLDVWYEKRDNTSKYIHPTQKPVQLAERALKRSSEKGDIVMDAFAGSGSTMIACDQLGRKFRGIELDPKYVDAIVGRWCKYKNDYTIIKNGKEIQWIA
jgi:site-specific DNA-methyltransferase (adenine-specific)